MRKSGNSGVSLYSRVARALGERILRSELTPGSVLPPEEELSKRLGISRSALREGLKLLVAKGLVEAKPKTGTRIRPRSCWNLLDPELLAWQAAHDQGNARFYPRLLELRLILEPSAAKLAAKRRQASDLQRMGQAIEAMENATTHDESFAGFVAFRQSILNATQNDLIGALQILVVDVPPRDDGRWGLLPKQCRSLLDCLVEQDEPQAEAFMRELVLFWNDATDSQNS